MAAIDDVFTLGDALLYGWKGTKGAVANKRLAWRFASSERGREGDQLEKLGLPTFELLLLLDGSKCVHGMSKLGYWRGGSSFFEAFCSFFCGKNSW